MCRLQCMSRRCLAFYMPLPPFKGDRNQEKGEERVTGFPPPPFSKALIYKKGTLIKIGAFYPLFLTLFSAMF